MSKHTPGPWGWHDDDLVAADFTTVIDCHEGVSPDVPDGERIANKNLIAAAPELLEALKDVTRRYMTLLAQQQYFPSNVTENVLDAAQATIAKAEGEQAQ
jgi:hypothetical protein